MAGHYWRRLIAGALVVFTPAAAFAQADPALVAAAKREGSVSFYAAYPNAAFQAATVKSFQDKYGVRVDLLQVRASELHERIRAEQASGRFLGDVLQASDASTALRVSTGHVGPLGDIPNARNLLPGHGSLEFRIPSFIAPFGIMINTALVKPEDEPKSWRDLLAPKWNGKILVDDPRALGSGHAFFVALLTALGEDFHRALAAHGVILSRDVGASERRAGRGEFPIWIPAATSGRAALNGLPVKYLAPAEGVPNSAMDHSILKNAPHPNAARLFIDHFLDVEFQTEVGKLGLLPVIRDMEARMPAEMQPFARVKLLPGATAENQQRMLDLAAEIYK